MVCSFIHSLVCCLCMNKRSHLKDLYWSLILVHHREAEELAEVEAKLVGFLLLIHA
jgi:hypothetical protein